MISLVVFIREDFCGYKVNQFISESFSAIYKKIFIINIPCTLMDIDEKSIPIDVGSIAQLVKRQSRYRTS